VILPYRKQSGQGKDLKVLKNLPPCAQYASLVFIILSTENYIKSLLGAV
jgi:hypothetical protein